MARTGEAQLGKVGGSTSPRQSSLSPFYAGHRLGTPRRLSVLSSPVPHALDNVAAASPLGQQGGFREEGNPLPSRRVGGKKETQGGDEEL